MIDKEKKERKEKKSTLQMRKTYHPVSPFPSFVFFLSFLLQQPKKSLRPKGNLNNHPSTAGAIVVVVKISIIIPKSLLLGQL